MAHFIRLGVKVVPAPKPNDPCYEFKADGFLIQLKHPNSTKQLRKQIAKFTRAFVREALRAFSASASRTLSRSATDHASLPRKSKTPPSRARRRRWTASDVTS